ncbi:MAG: MATE family efflux transporter [Clostridia bacterium]|nr:MATE family efflux transporter [Clostridia bacterium]
MKFRRDTDMTQGSIVKQLLSFALPMMLGLLFQQLYNTVDTLVVGQFVGAQALAAVGCNSSIINTVVGSFVGLSTGATVVISQAYGAHDDERLSKAVHTTMAVTLILCILATGIGLLTARPLLKLTKPSETAAEALADAEAAQTPEALTEGAPEEYSDVNAADTASDVSAETETFAEYDSDLADQAEAALAQDDEDDPEDIDKVFELAETYLMIFFAGVSGVLIYNMGTGILRAVGDSTRPVYYLIISALINTVLDLLFVALFKWGVAGVALATIIAQFISAVLVMIALMRSTAAYGLRLKKLRISGDVLGRIVRIGLPSAIQNAVTAFSNVFVQKYINSLGTYGMAGWTAYNKLDAFLVLPVQAIAMASTTFVGQCWGANLKRRAREGVKQTMLLSISVTVGLALLFVAFATPLLKIFTRDENVLEKGRYFVRVISPFYFTICFTQVYAGALRGIGNATAPTVAMLLSFVAFRQLYLFVFSQLLHGGDLVIALAYPMGWLLCSVLLVVLYRRSALFKTDDNFT